MKTSNLLEQKLEMQNLPFFSDSDYSKFENDHIQYESLKYKIASTWLKTPEKSMYIGELSENLPARGTQLLFQFDTKVKDKKAMFGFRFVSEVKEGSFFGMFVSKKADRECIYVKVLCNGLVYQISSDCVITK